MSLPVPSPATTVTVFAAVQQLPDPRDNRGKRHELAFVLCGVILAIMAGRSRVSAIHRYPAQSLGVVTRAHAGGKCAAYLAGAAPPAPGPS